MARGICLASQEIRDCTKNGKITGRDIQESQIQPSSFDPRIGNELFILDRESRSLFRPEPGETVYRSLLRLPRRQRTRVSIERGFELKRGFTYLVPLEERIRLDGGEYAKYSPKSSMGRLFLDTRALADFNPCYDETNWQYSTDELQQWLLLQPLAFNLIIYPGLTFNQLRIFRGYGAKLSPSEIFEEFRRRPFLFRKEGDNNLSPVSPMVTDDLQIHLNLSGKYTWGVVGLRARHNPVFIDLHQGDYPAEDYFEPLMTKDGKVDIKEREHYLLSSEEILVVPDDLSIELQMHSNIGLRGELHFAGFVDNGFTGDLVFEVSSTELADANLQDGMPISKLDVFRTSKPDKVYSTAIGSHYVGQVGPRPPKYFKTFDYKLAAKNYAKLSRDVLCQDAQLLMRFRKSGEGFEPGGDLEGLLKCINEGFFHSRYDCEDDTLVYQAIPYVLIFGPDGSVFRYVRAKDIQDFGEPKLFGKHSVGVGGHINRGDAPDYVSNSLEREVHKEEVKFLGSYSKPVFAGTLVSSRKPVDRVHFGLVYAIHTNHDVRPNESSIITGKFSPIDELVGDVSAEAMFETWSYLLIPHLREIYDKTRLAVPA